MAVFRILNDNKAIPVRSVPKDEEENFIKSNPINFILVDDNILNETIFDDVFIYNPETKTVEIDKERELIRYKQYYTNLISKDTEDKITEALTEKFDENTGQKIADTWGNDYKEIISELNNSLLTHETEIVYILTVKYNIPNITITDLRKKITQFLAGQYTEADLYNDLKNLGFTEEDIYHLSKVFVETALISKIVYTIDKVIWKTIEEKYEPLIFSSTSKNQIIDIYRNDFTTFIEKMKIKLEELNKALYKVETS
jgi:hypothetical protein